MYKVYLLQGGAMILIGVMPHTIGKAGLLEDFVGEIVGIDEYIVIEKKYPVGAKVNLIESITVPTAAAYDDSFEPIKPRQDVGQAYALKGETIDRPKTREGAGEPIRGPPINKSSNTSITRDKNYGPQISGAFLLKNIWKNEELCYLYRSKPYQLSNVIIPENI